MNILSLDLASCTGFCYGAPGEAIPEFGSIRFGKVDCSRQAVFGGALRWVNQFLAAHDTHRIVFEEPLHFGLRRGNSRAGNDEIAYGLPAIVQAVAFMRGIYEVHTRRTSDVRQHFIGENPKREIGKHMTMMRCRALGFHVVDDNQADAVATWFYECALIDPSQALRATPLFGRTGRIAEVFP